MIDKTIKDWKIDEDLKGLSPLTIKLYGDVVGKFFDQCPKNPGVVDLHDIKKYLLRFKETPHMLNQIIKGLKKFYQFLVEEGKINDNIIEKVKEVKLKKSKLPIIFSNEETGKIINLPQLTIKEKSILHLLAETGMRNAELCNILTENIDIKKKTIVLEDTKNGEARYVFFRENTQKLLKKYLTSLNINSIYLFHNHWGRKMINCHINNLVKKAVGIAFPFDTKKRSLSHCHTFRHSFVTSWIRAGGSIPALQHIVGWSSLSMLKVYTHLNAEALQDTYNECYDLKHKKGGK